jgi:hypothetical protein
MAAMRVMPIDAIRARILRAISQPAGFVVPVGETRTPASRVEHDMRAVIALGLLVAFTLVAAANTQRAASVSGRYARNWDEVTLVQNGNRITGTYVCCGGGTIEGRIYEGRVIRYRWTQPGGSGLGVWTIDGDQLLGTWGSGDSDHDGGRWDLDRAAPRIAR